MAMSVGYTNFGGELVAEDRGGVTSYYVPDNLGSTVSLLDSTGSISDTFTYWPYGEIRTRTGSTATLFTYVGGLGYYRVSSTRFYVQARDLRVDQARWATVDPLWPWQKAYGYVDNQPTDNIDPSGLCNCGEVTKSRSHLSDSRHTEGSCGSITGTVEGGINGGGTLEFPGLGSVQLGGSFGIGAQVMCPCTIQVVIDVYKEKTCTCHCVPLIVGCRTYIYSYQTCTTNYKTKKRRIKHLSCPFPGGEYDFGV
jgi:RHS repeat-associated protein